MKTFPQSPLKYGPEKEWQGSVYSRHWRFKRNTTAIHLSVTKLVLQNSDMNFVCHSSKQV